MKLGNRGQMRVIEAMIACVILIIGLSATAYFSSTFTTEEGGDIEEVAQVVIHVLDNTDIIKQIIQNEGDWESKLKSLLQTLLPPDTFYNLTLISGLTGQPLAGVITNMEGQDLSSSLDAVSLQHIITISLPIAKIEQKELDVILVIDRSDSMNDPEPGGSKFYYAKKAAKAFVDQLNVSKDRVGVVSFSGDDDQYSYDDATLESPLTSNFQEVKWKIGNLTTWWRTNMGEGFVKAGAEFMAPNRSSAIKAIIFLSDGMANEPHFSESWYIHQNHQGSIPCPIAQQYARNESKKVADRGVLIYTIGLGAYTYRFDEQLLKDIQTNGYYYAPSGQDLVDIYMAIAQDLLFEVKYEIVVLTLTLVKAG